MGWGAADGWAECLRDEGGDGPQAVGEDHGASDRDEDGEDALRVRDRQDVPVAHRAAASHARSFCR